MEQPSLEPELQNIIGDMTPQAVADIDEHEATTHAVADNWGPVLPDAEKEGESAVIEDEEDVPAVISRQTAMSHVDSLVAFGLSRNNTKVVELLCQL